MTSRVRTGRGEPSEAHLAWLLVLPALSVIFAVKLFPVVYSMWLSVHSVSLLSPTSAFVGLANFERLFANPQFVTAVGRTVYFTVVSLTLQVTLGLAIA